MAIELYSVIKNDGPAGLLYWHFQGENFRTGSQLIVAENEEALFVREGVVVETFSGGRFTLTTNNYPFIDKMRAFFSGGENAFTCGVCFVNKADALELKWGTDAPIAVRDPVFGVMTKVQGRGAFTIRVRNAKQFYLKFVGNNVQAVTEEAIRQRFRSATLQKVKTLIGKTILASGMEVLANMAWSWSISTSVRWKSRTMTPLAPFWRRRLPKPPPIVPKSKCWGRIGNVFRGVTF